MSARRRIEITIEGSTEALRRAFPPNDGLSVWIWLGPVTCGLSRRGIDITRSGGWRLGVRVGFRSNRRSAGS